MGIPDLFKTAATYLDFVVDFLSFRGLVSFSLKDSTSYVLVSFYVCGFGIARFLELADPFRKKVDEAAIFEEEYDVLAERTKFNRIYLSSEPAFSPLVRTLYGNLGFHIFLVLSSGMFGVQPISAKVTLNATLAFNAVFLPFAAFIEPFRILGLKLMKDASSSRSATLIGLLIAVVISMLNLGSEIYRFWAMAELHGIGISRLAIPVVSYWSLWLCLLICFWGTRSFLKHLDRRRSRKEWADI